MNKLTVILLVLLAAFVASAAHLADHAFGVVAFTYRYLAFCVVATLVFGCVWYARFGTSALAFGLIVFSVLAANFFLPPPSVRLLRSAILNTPPGTDATQIAGIVEQQYEGSVYAIPQMRADRAGGFDRVHVSLLNQKAKDCTAAIFIIENGQVSRSIFSPD